MTKRSRLLPAIALSLAQFLAVTSAGNATTEAVRIPDIKELVGSTSLAGSYLAAQMAARENDDETAVAYYQRSIELDPGNAELKRLYFLALTANGRIADAVKISISIPAADEQAPIARLVSSVDAMQRADWKAVREFLKDPASGDLDQMVEKLIVAWATLGEGDAKKAVEIATAISGPDWVEVIRNYHAGLIHSASGDDKAAVPLLAKAIENRDAAAVLSETFMHAVEALVGAHSRLGETDKAKAVLAGGFEILPTYSPFIRLQKALNANEKIPLLVADAKQGGTEVFYNVGTAISRQGGTPFAQGYLQMANHITPDRDYVAMALAGIFEVQRRHERANEYYDRIQPTSDFHRRAELEYALNLNDLKKVDESKAKLRALIAEDPADLLAYSTLGGVLSQHEEYAEAVTVFETAVAGITKPERQHWNLFYRLGIAYERTKQWPKAETAFKKALEISPDQADVLNYLGYSWIDQGINLDEGLAMIRKAVELSPRKGYIIDSLGWAYFKLKRYDDAVRELERAVEILPRDAVLNDHLGDAYWMAGRKLEATFQWNHALVFKPEPADEAHIKQKLEKGFFEKPAATAAQ